MGALRIKKEHPYTSYQLKAGENLWNCMFTVFVLFYNILKLNEILKTYTIHILEDVNGSVTAYT